MTKEKPMSCCDTGMRSAGQVHDRGCQKAASYGAVMSYAHAQAWLDTEREVAKQAVTAAVAAEREACAIYAEAILEQGTGYHPGCPNTLAEVIHEDACKRIIAAIRARGAEGKEK